MPMYAYNGIYLPFVEEFSDLCREVFIYHILEPLYFPIRSLSRSISEVCPPHFEDRF